MPIQRCYVNGKTGWRWGKSGKCYTGKNAYRKAKAQEIAIRSTGWTENVYNPNQPRDWRGRWTSGGGSGGGKVLSFRKAGTEGFDFSPEQAQKSYDWAMENMGDIRKKISGEALDAVDHYAGLGFSDINNRLRGEKVSSVADTTKIDKTVRVLDKVIDQNEIPTDVEVFRGIKLVDQENFEPIPGLEFKPGQVIEDKSFSSTSTTSILARRFAGRADEGAVMMINLPKGTKAIFRDSSESEIILKRNQKIRVDSVSKMNNGLTLVEATAID